MNELDDIVFRITDVGVRNATTLDAMTFGSGRTRVMFGVGGNFPEAFSDLLDIMPRYGLHAMDWIDPMLSELGYDQDDLKACKSEITHNAGSTDRVYLVILEIDF